MMDWLFGCTHSRTTFPITPGRKSAVKRSTYVVCLDCGKEFSYDWAEMRIGNELPAAGKLVPQPLRTA